MLIHERDGLLQRAPGDKRVEERGTHHEERLGTTCVAFRPLYLLYRLSQDGFMAFWSLYSVTVSHLTHFSIFLNTLNCFKILFIYNIYFEITHLDE